MKNTVLFLSILFFSVPFAAQAQMFSVGDDDNFRSNPFAPYIRAGITTVDFSYQGESNAQNAGILELNELAANLIFESGGLSIGMTLANELTGAENQNYFDLSLDFNSPLIITARPTYVIGVPIKLGSKLTSVRHDNTSLEFSQTNLSAGLGGMFMLHFPELLGINVQFIPSYGFSSSSGGFIGGNVFSLSGRSRVNFYSLFLGKNISLGYDFNYDSYDIDGEDHDYDFTGHTITIGISF